jgi:hypothetical protein
MVSSVPIWFMSCLPRLYDEHKVCLRKPLNILKTSRHGGAKGTTSDVLQLDNGGHAKDGILTQCVYSKAKQVGLATATHNMNLKI